MRLNRLDGQDKIDQDYASLNLAIEHQTEEEIKRLRENINALKEKAGKIGEALTNLSAVSEKSSIREKT